MPVAGGSLIIYYRCLRCETENSTLALDRFPGQQFMHDIAHAASRDNGLRQNVGWIAAV